MGNPISSLRKAVDQSDDEKQAMHERLNILERMVNQLLDNAKIDKLYGDRGNQEIQTGTVVEYSKQVNIALSNRPGDDLDTAIKHFFGKTIKEGFEKVVTAAVDAVLGNASMGEHEGSNMFIQWSDNALLRLDAYYYRWNFSSNEIIKGVEGVSGVLVMKRVIPFAATDPQVLTWAVSRQANVLGSKNASDMIDDAAAVIQKINALQLAIHSRENEGDNEGMEEKTE